MSRTSTSTRGTTAGPGGGPGGRPAPGPIAISVVVPAYKAAKTLPRLIASLDAQTLPQAQFETIVVDDGSPDDSPAVLKALAATRPNLHVERIAPSGWASRPRNHGTDLAVGEYVLYVDADDTLYPDALRRSVEFAREHGADVVSPKESKTNAPWWGMDRWDANIPNLVGGIGIEGLLPMMPHKVYRRAFLAEHGIRYPEGEGGARVLWEDIWFNMAAYRHASVVSVLSDTPVYRWHATAGSISGSYGPKTAEFWRQLEALFAHIRELFAGEEHRASREAMLLHQYRDRVLLRLSRMIATADAETVAIAVGNARRIQAEYVPEALEARLGKLVRARGILLRSNRPDLMAELWADDRSVRQTSRATSLGWAEGRMRVALSTTWVRKDAGPLPFRLDGDQVVRVLPAALEAALPLEVREVGSLEPATAVWVRSRTERVTWAVPATSETRYLQAADGTLELEVVTEALVDPSSAAVHGRLDEAVWDVWAETRWHGAGHRSEVGAPEESRPALTDGRTAVAYRNNNGMISLDLAGRLRSVLRDGRPATGPIADTAAAFAIELPAVAVHGPMSVAVELTLEPEDPAPRWLLAHPRTAGLLGGRSALEALRPTLPGRIVADTGGARLESGGDVRAGRFRIRICCGDAALPTGLALTVAADGTVALDRNTGEAPSRSPIDRLVTAARGIRLAATTGRGPAIG